MIHTCGTGSRKKKNDDEVRGAGVVQATPLVPPNPTVGAVVPPTIAHAGRPTRKSLVSFGADADDTSGTRKKRNNDEANIAEVESSGTEAVGGMDAGHIHADKRRRL